MCGDRYRRTGDRRRRRDDPHFVERPRVNRRRVARHALLQQQFGRLHARVGVEAHHHRIAEERVRQRDQRHALVVREIGPDDGPRDSALAPGRAHRARPRRGGVIDRVEEP